MTHEPDLQRRVAAALHRLGLIRAGSARRAAQPPRPGGLAGQDWGLLAAAARQERALRLAADLGAAWGGDEAALLDALESAELWAGGVDLERL